MRPWRPAALPRLTSIKVPVHRLWRTTVANTKVPVAPVANTKVPLAPVANIKGAVPPRGTISVVLPSRLRRHFRLSRHLF